MHAYMHACMHTCMFAYNIPCLWSFSVRFAFALAGAMSYPSSSMYVSVAASLSISRCDRGTTPAGRVRLSDADPGAVLPGSYPVLPGRGELTRRYSSSLPSPLEKLTCRLRGDPGDQSDSPRYASRGRCLKWPSPSSAAAMTTVDHCMDHVGQFTT